jgi:DNA mismatch endonuclease (patch repair protein)
MRSCAPQEETRIERDSPEARRRKRSQIMAAVRSRGNRSTEIRFLRILREHRIQGWRRNQRIRGNPDFVFWESRVVVFVDGCFWHGCPKHLRMPSTNRSYWNVKIERNVLRDKKTNRDLQRRGWQVVRFWEHELALADRVVRKLKKALSGQNKGVQLGERHGKCGSQNVR